MDIGIFQTPGWVQDHSASAKKAWIWNPSRDFSQLHSQHSSRSKSVPCFLNIGQGKIFMVGFIEYFQFDVHQHLLTVSLSLKYLFQDTILFADMIEVNVAYMSGNNLKVLFSALNTFF